MTTASSNTLYPAIRRLAAAALEAAGSGPCQVCGRDQAQGYAFAYGKKLDETSSSSTSGSTTTTVTTTTYGDLHAHAVHLCAASVAAHRRAMAIRLWITIAILAIVSISLIAATILMPGDQIGLTILATVSPFAVLVYVVKLHKTLTQPELAGQDKALRLDKKALQKAGYDSFWRDPSDPGSV